MVKHPRRRRRKKSSGGFTLVELLIALAISMVGLLGLLSLQMIAIRSNSASRNFSEALGLAQEKLEMLEVQPVANFTIGTTVTTETGVLPSPGSNAALALYTRKTTTITNGTTVNIEVDVTWTDPYLNIATPVTHKVTVYDVRSL